MKQKLMTAAILLLLATNVVSFLKATKFYNDAAKMSDLIRCYQDHLNEEDSNIQDYGCFEELCGTFLWGDINGTVELENYVYCY